MKEKHLLSTILNGIRQSGLFMIHPNYTVSSVNVTGKLILQLYLTPTVEVGYDLEELNNVLKQLGSFFTVKQVKDFKIEAAKNESDSRIVIGSVYVSSDVYVPVTIKVNYEINSSDRFLLGISDKKPLQLEESGQFRPVCLTMLLFPTSVLLTATRETIIPFPKWNSLTHLKMITQA